MVAMQAFKPETFCTSTLHLIFCFGAERAADPFPPHRPVNEERIEHVSCPCRQANAPAARNGNHRTFQPLRHPSAEKCEIAVPRYAGVLKLGLGLVPSIMKEPCGSFNPIIA